MFDSHPHHSAMKNHVRAIDKKNAELRGYIDSINNYQQRLESLYDEDHLEGFQAKLACYLLNEHVGYARRALDDITKLGAALDTMQDVLLDD